MIDERLPFMERVRRRALANMPGSPAAYKVYQGKRLVGYLPGLPTTSRSGLYDIRPHDFKFVDRGDGLVIEAHTSLGPGDFSCLPGFEDAGGYEPPLSDAAQEFDKLEREQKIKKFIEAVKGLKPPEEMP